MPRKNRLPGLVAAGCLICMVPAWGEDEAPRPPDWHFFGNAVYSSRSLGGSVVSKNEAGDGKYVDMVTTADGMGVGNSDGVMLALGVQYKRFGIAMNYMPTSFEGTGWALAGGTGADAGVIVKTPLQTNISVDMLLASLYYNFIQTPETIFGVGMGLGQTTIDLSIVPDVGTALVYSGDQPFAFFNVHFQNSYGRFLYGFSLNGLSLDYEGTEIVYSDYKLDLGYRLYDGRTKVNLLGGYRLVNFAIDLEGTGYEIAADVSLEGPFLGISVIY